ncbi:hypothetical protein, partial [Acinetobacter baumannii]|uniref:hypothetical protein n=1 Tax=Acinetobacter baumannii TaxID=470 RepID=UPI0037BF9B8D
SSFENYIAEKAFTDRFVQQSRLNLIFNIMHNSFTFLHGGTNFSFSCWGGTTSDKCWYKYQTKFFHVKRLL